MSARHQAVAASAEAQRLRTALETVRVLLVQGNFIKASFVTRQALDPRPLRHNSTVERTGG